MNRVFEEDLETIIGEDIEWEKLKGKRVLITGASGMIGTYMLHALTMLNDRRSYGIRVLAMLRNVSKLPQEIREREDVEVIAHDVTEKLSIEGDVDYIIHAASNADPRNFSSAHAEPAGGDHCGEHAWNFQYAEPGKRKESGWVSFYFFKRSLRTAGGWTGIFP